LALVILSGCAAILKISAPLRETNPFPKQKGGEVPARPLLVLKAVSSDNRDREKQAAERDCADEAGQFLHVRSFYLPHSR
jgi:hypothetical protein